MTVKKIVETFKGLLRRNPLVPKVKDKLIFSGWLLMILLIAGMSWHLSQPLRTRSLQRAANRALEQLGHGLRLGEALPPADFSRSRMGSYFSALGNTGYPAGTGRVKIFTFIAEGTFFPCAAIIGADGKVENFIALNKQGENILMQISPGVLRLYAWRLEGESP